jgi:hypothetical protein
VRFSEGVLAIPFLSVVWLRHRRPAALVWAVCGGGLGAGVFVGLVDLVTWGRPFHSLAEFWRIMYANHPPSFPHYDKPGFWYVTACLRWAGPIAVVLGIAGSRVRRARLPFALLGLIVVAYSVFAYKAYRYLQGAIPFLALVMGIGCARLLSSSGTRQPALARLMIVLAAAWGIERTSSLLHDRSRNAIDAALFMRTLRPRAVLLEQEWAYGGRLVFGNEVRIQDLEPRRPLNLANVSQALGVVDAAAFYERDLPRGGHEYLHRWALASPRAWLARATPA